MSDYSIARKNMLDSQLSTNGIVDGSVLDVFEKIPRELFLPEKFESLAYIDEDLLLDNNTFLMDPLVCARIIQAAQIEQDDIVLNLGDTTGFSSAVLSAMVTTVVVLESKIGILDKARKVWAEMDLCNIAVLKGDCSKGCAEHAPYTLIIINGAVPEIPYDLADQLSVDGRMVCVVKKLDQHIGQVTVVKKLDTLGFSTVRLFDAATPYLDEFLPGPTFTF